MNGQFLSGKQITVDYALKANSKTEKHGSMAERLLAANNPSIYQPVNQKQLQKMYKAQILENQ
jgi:splicing factor 3B subunit 4